MIKLNVNQTDIEQLLRYHSEYITQTVRRNWENMYAKADKKEEILKLSQLVNQAIDHRCKCQTENKTSGNAQENRKELFFGESVRLLHDKASRYLCDLCRRIISGSEYQEQV